MAQYGLVTDVDTTKRELRDLNRDYNARRTWSGLETNLGLSAQSAFAQAGRDYSTEMSAAYQAAKMQQRQINMSGIVGQQGAILQQENERALQEAYNSYVSQYLQRGQSIQEGYTEGMNKVDETLTEEAQNYNAYADKHYDYLEYLYNQYPELFKTREWQNYLNIEQGDDGQPVTRLKTREELYRPNYVEYTDAEGNEYKDYTSLYDDKGNLTLAGVEYFDILENANIKDENIPSFGRYLAQTDTNFLQEYYGYTKSEAEAIAKANSDLLQWSESYNPYDYNADISADGQVSTHKGTFKTMTGRMSTDYAYSFAERMGGLTHEQIDKMFEDYKWSALKLQEKMSKAKDKAESITKEVSGLVDSIHNLAKEMGIDADLNLDWDALTAKATELYKSSESGWSMTATWFGDALAYAGTGAAAGATIGGIGASIAGIGSGPLAPIIGIGGSILGTIVGAIVGFIGGVVKGSIDVDKQRKQNEKVAKQAQELYNNTLAAMTTYVAHKRRDAEIEFNRLNQF